MHLKMVPLGEAMDQREPREFVDKITIKGVQSLSTFIGHLKCPLKNICTSKIQVHLKEQLA
jgi:hypothetical protein